MREQRMNNSRYANMHRVCHILMTIGEAGAGEIAKHCSLSRQSVNKILQDCHLYGYVDFVEEQYRINSIKRTWHVCSKWIDGSDRYIQFYKRRDSVVRKK